MPRLRINQHVLNFFWFGAVPSVAAFGYYMARAPDKDKLAEQLVSAAAGVLCSKSASCRLVQSSTKCVLPGSCRAMTTCVPRGHDTRAKSLPPRLESQN